MQTLESILDLVRGKKLAGKIGHTEDMPNFGLSLAHVTDFTMLER